jgi:dienelactone hydrolase
MLIKIFAVFLFCIQGAIAQTSVEYNESIFGDHITYINADNKQEKIYIKLANITKEKKNTVIYMHGCGGLREHTRVWTKQLVEWNYNVVVVDSFTGRGMPQGACEINHYLKNPPHDRVHDLFAVAEWISKQPWNKNKPAVVGFSHGGNTVYLASNSGEYSAKARSLLSSGVSFYPWCWSFVNPGEWPLQVHVGTSDDWNPAATCYKLNRHNRPTLEFHLYENAYHGWDIPGADYTLAGGNGNVVVPRVIRFNYEVNKVSRANTKRWLDQHFEMSN